MKTAILKRLQSALDDLAFDLSLSDRLARTDISNSTVVERLIEVIKEDHEDADTSALESALAAYKALSSGVSREDVKKVWRMLKDRELHPCGEFDKAGRFYLRDSELVNVRRPSAKYPYSQMHAGRTSKFVTSIADKYKCQTFEELKNCFKSV